MDDHASEPSAFIRPDLGPAFDGLPLPSALLDAQSFCIIAANAALLGLLGCAEYELIGQPLSRVQDAPTTQDGPVRLRARNGREHALQQYLRPQGAGRLLWSAHPVAMETESAQLDPLTTLYSRRAFEARLRARLAAGGEGALVYLELDQFKLVNDAYGREAGNDLLAQFGRLLQTLVRSGDEPAYLGGDEFALLLADADLDRAWQAAERVRFQVSAQGFEWRGRGYGLTVSIGIAGFGAGSQDYTELIGSADAACAAAKNLGRNRIEIFRADQDEIKRVRGEQSWGMRVLDVLEGGRFALYRQRIVPLAGGVPHYEVLLRPQGALGWTLPGEFVAAAERYGLMAQLDRRIIARTVRALAQASIADMPSAAVNLSGSSLNEAGLAAFVSRVIDEFELAPERLRFEITETAAIANIQRAVALVQALRELGCGVALDDFGTGMSSFSYLKALAVDTIKIDGSFVRGVASDPMDAATVEAIVRLARLRGLHTVAECVEDEDTLLRLRDLGLDQAQGFHLHRPEAWSMP
jgi:diguanylate cyclase (GGDEF)-like protein